MLYGREKKASVNQDDVYNEGWASRMTEENVPQYEITCYKLEPPVGPYPYGAKPRSRDHRRIRPGEPWNKECWGRTEEEAMAKAEMAVEQWLTGQF